MVFCEIPASGAGDCLGDIAGLLMINPMAAKIAIVVTMIRLLVIIGLIRGRLVDPAIILAGTPDVVSASCSSFFRAFKIELKRITS
jgi:hypothetical protein